VRLGGGAIVFDPLRGKPPRMHRWTYWRLFAAAIKAQERVLGLEIDEARRRFPGLFTEEIRRRRTELRRSGARSSSRRGSWRLGTVATGLDNPRRG